MPENEHLTRKQKRSLHRMIGEYIRSTLFFWAPGLVFIVIANEVRSTEPLPGDIAILTAIRAFINDPLTRIFEVITALASTPFVVTGVAVAAVTLWYIQLRRQALFLLFASGGTAAINVALKLFFTRERPDLWQHLVIEYSYSFPSGHAMISSALALAVIILTWQTRYRYAAIVLGVLYTVLVGFSRLYLGVHFPSDVLAGWCISILWVLTLHHVFARYNKGRNIPDMAKE